jgi:hypothetical protein
MYIHFDPELPWEEVIKAAPYLQDREERIQILIDGYAYILFDTYEEMRTMYYMTVGDDGPTSTNPYSGVAKVYALTCGPKGFLTENT